MRKINLVTILFLTISFVKLYGQIPLKTTSPNDEFILIEDMSDEFNTGNINWSNRWEKTNNLPNIAAWNLTNESNVSEGNYFNRGAARITARYNGKKGNSSIAVNGKFYNAGCLQSQKSLPPNFEGYVEAVIRGADVDNKDPHPFNEGIDSGRGLCPSFWLYSKFFDNNPAEGDVIYTEIDIQELQQHDFHNDVQDMVEDTESNLHIAFKDGNKRRWVRPKRNPREQLNKYNLGFDPRKDWHTYGCEITKEELNFFVDGKKVGKTLKNTHWGKLPLRVIMSLGMRVPFVDFGGNAFTSFDPQGTYPNDDRLKNLAERARKQLGELPESMYVDYVRVWNKKIVVCSDEDAVITNLNTTGNTKTSITVTFDDKIPGVDTFELRAWPKGDFTGSLTTPKAVAFKVGSSSPLTISGLEAGEEYTLVLRGVCSEGGTTKISQINSTTAAVIDTDNVPLVTVNPNDEFVLIEDMSDEFNNANVNWSKKWEETNNLPNIAAWNLTNEKNVSEDNYFDRGAARITARYNGKKGNTSIAVNGKFYNSGCLQSQKSLPPNFEGYIEAVIRGADIDNKNPHPFNQGIDSARGLCPSFWLYSKFFDNNPAEGDVIYTEIDIQELQQHDFHDNIQDAVDDTESNLHIAFKDGDKRRWVRPKKNPEGQLNKYNLGFDPRKDWHTYGCEITKEEINFFVDGKKVGKTLKNTHWGKLPLRVIMSLGMRVPFVDFGGNAFTSFDPQGNYPDNDRLKNLAERARKQLGELPESMYVDYVRVWNKKGNDQTTDACNADAIIKGLNVITSTETSITVAFDEISGVDSYELRAWPKGDFTGSLNTPKAFSFKGGNSSPLTISSLDAGEEYTLVLRGLCSAGGSTEVSQIDAATIGNTPVCDTNAVITGLNAIASTETSITVAFDEMSGIDTYELRAWTKGSFTGSINTPKAFSFKGGSSSPLTISGLNEGEEYTLVLRGVCNVGGSTEISQIETATVGSVPECNPNAVITGLNATTITKTTITVEFDEISGVDTYELRAWEKESFTGNINTPKAFSFKGGSTSPLTISGLNEGEEYTLVLRGLCSVGKSTEISQINVTTIASVPVCNPEAIITGLKASTSTTSTITLAFDEVPGINNYELRAWEKGDFTGNINAPKPVSFKGGSTSPLTIANLDSRKEYTLVLRGVCGIGKSTKVSQINAVTKRRAVTSKVKIGSIDDYNNIITTSDIVNVFPNPVKGEQFTILLASDVVSEISVFDIEGKKVYQNQFSKKSINFKRNSLGEAGMYFMKIKQGKSIIIKKIILQ